MCADNGWKFLTLATKHLQISQAFDIDLVPQNSLQIHPSNDGYRFAYVIPHHLQILDILKKKNVKGNLGIPSVVLCHL